MRISYTQSGSGPPLSLLHGWGMNAAVWGEAADRLAAHCTLRAVDLPGHGGSKAVPLVFSAEVLAEVAALLPPGGAVLGWSLGGMLAQLLAVQHPERVGRLILLSTTPRFPMAADWAHGVRPEVLADFAARLERDPHATLLRFLALQALGSGDARRQIARLRESLRAQPPVPAATLAAGLTLLADTDLRSQIADIIQPTLVIGGGRDTLTPLAASDWLAATLPRAQSVRIVDGAHALFLSHTDLFVDSVLEFVSRPA
jgi:pimeloyl-[acyl-carrier protein] methyl ester esterase